jgi:hypothetical protein
MMVGDNIYHRNSKDGAWHQEDSHHSLPDGTVNQHNLSNDTQTNVVLIADVFYYFGSCAPIVPENISNDLGYKNGRSYRKYLVSAQAAQLLQWLTSTYSGSENTVIGDPFDFHKSNARYSAETNKVST